MIGAVIFDLDGVIVTTDECHYRAWKRISDEEGIAFDRTVNERLRGVSRMRSLEIILESASAVRTEEQKRVIAERKNEYYRQFIGALTPADILPGVVENIGRLRASGVKTAIGSSSRNAPVILERIGLTDSFDAVADGNAITKSKPDPEVFLLAAEMLKEPAERCLVVEDADAGIEAGRMAGMATLAVGKASGADFYAPSLAETDIARLIKEYRR